MIPLRYERATDLESAHLLRAENGATFLAGGTNLVDLMRETIEHPELLVDVSRLSSEIEATPDGGLKIGAGVKNTTVAANQLVLQRYPLLAQAILAGASAQIRNMASVGGNILQRTRCLYFYDDAASCNKRVPGSGCDAIGGFNRYHALFGASDACVATHPSDMCVALAALDAVVTVESTTATRQIPLPEFHRLPGETPDIETVLQPGELITAVIVPPNGFAGRSSYRKVRDRASYAFALVSLAAGIEMDGNVIKDVRLALGGVAHKPWRARIAEESLRGKPLTETSVRAAAAAEMAAAKGLRDNAFKIDLAKRLMTDLVLKLGATAEAGQ